MVTEIRMEEEAERGTAKRVLEISDKRSWTGEESRKRIQGEEAQAASRSREGERALGNSGGLPEHFH